MQSLDRPGYLARDVFLSCIRNVRAEELRERLEAIADDVEGRSEVYHDAASRRSLHEIQREGMVGGQVTAKEMGRVYSNRMAKREYLKLCVWRSAHAVKTGHLLNRSG